MNYAEQATAAKAKARDILRSQAAIRIQQRVQDATTVFNKAVRRYAKMVVEFAQDVTDAADEATKRTAKRAAMDAALAEVPGVSPAELAGVTDSLATERAENDASRAADEKSASDAQTKALAAAAEAIVAARADLAHHTENLTKLQNGEIKVDADELKELAAKLIEEERAD